MTLVAVVINAQSIERSVVGSAGSFIDNGSLSINSTVGEVAVATFSAGSFVLIQGYQQSQESFSSVNQKQIDVSYKLYPNPTKGLAKLELNAGNNPVNLVVSVYGEDGKLVNSKFVKDTYLDVIDLDFLKEKPRVYFVKILDMDSEVIKTIRLIKN